VKKLDKSSPKDGNIYGKNTDQIWCPEGGHYQYVEGCRALRKVPSFYLHHLRFHSFSLLINDLLLSFFRNPQQSD